MHSLQLFLGLFYCLMIYLHLLWIVFLQPFVLVYLFMNELYGYLTVDLHCSFSDATIVEPRLYPPLYAVLVGIDGYLSLDVEGLDVYVEVG